METPFDTPSNDTAPPEIQRMATNAWFSETDAEWPVFRELPEMPSAAKFILDLYLGQPPNGTVSS